MKWFPDRPGMATGMAIMGFGGGALIGGPLAEELMKRFASNTSVGAHEAMLVMAGMYAISMLFGAWIVRVPPEGWKPQGWTPQQSESQLITTANVGVDNAWKTPQFWMLWVVLCMNVSAGIGILGQASPMIQDMFKVTPAAAAGYVGLLSLCNLGGRFLWSSLSDVIGRKTTYCLYFIIGAALYLSVPWIQGRSGVTLFVVVTGLILTMYGGGFATIPAYLRDLFGSHQVGAIHGRLITAWSMAALIGPQLVDRLSQANKASGIPAAKAYNPIFYLMAGLLGVGLISNFLVRPVDRKYHLPQPSEPAPP
jgi:nitrate/nitrite transporter NarK